AAAEGPYEQLVAVGGDRARAAPVGPQEPDAGARVAVHDLRVGMAEAVPMADGDEGDTWRHRGHEPGSTARTAAMVRDLQDLGGHSAQGILPRALDVPRQQDRDLSPAYREPARVVVAARPGRTTGP